MTLAHPSLSCYPVPCGAISQLRFFSIKTEMPNAKEKFFHKALCHLVPVVFFFGDEVARVGHNRCHFGSGTKVLLSELVNGSGMAIFRIQNNLSRDVP